MNKEEIKKYVEEEFEWSCEETGLTREEVEEMVITNIMFRYTIGEINKKDLMQCAEYMNCEIDIAQLDKNTFKNQLRKEKRHGGKQV